MISKSTLVKMFNSKAYQVSDPLGIDYCFNGRNADKTKYTPDASKPYINWQMILGDDVRPYLNGADGKYNTSIYQASVFYPKAGKSFPDLDALDMCELLEAEFPLDLALTQDGITARVFNVTTSQSLEDENYIYYVLSITFTVVV